MAIYPSKDKYLVFGKETGGYGVAPGTVNSHFGLIQKATGRIKNNIQSYRGIGAGRNAAHREVGGLLDTGINMTFQVINGSFLEYVFGTKTGSGTAGDPYVYAEADTLSSLTIEDANNLSTDQVLRFLGSVCKRMTIRCRLGEPVEVDMEFDSYDVSKSNTYQSINVPSTAIYHFVHGAFEVPSGTTISEVQEITIVIDNKTKRYGGIGDRKGVVEVTTREYSGTVKKWITDGTHMEDAMGGSASTSDDTPSGEATLQLDLTDGSRYIRITLNNVDFDWEGNAELERETEENITFGAKSGGAEEVV